MITTETKICYMKIEKEQKQYMRSYYYKRKNLLNHLINCVEESENVSQHKWIFKYFKSIKK